MIRFLMSNLKKYGDVSESILMEFYIVKEREREKEWERKREREIEILNFVCFLR